VFYSCGSGGGVAELEGSPGSLKSELGIFRRTSGSAKTAHGGCVHCIGRDAREASL
jgi:hypothetical protein